MVSVGLCFVPISTNAQFGHGPLPDEPRWESLVEHQLQRMSKRRVYQGWPWIDRSSARETIRHH